MLVYVAAGPLVKAALLFLSKTRVERLCAACAMFGCKLVPLVGVAAPPVAITECGIIGVELPLLFCVAMTDASLRDASAMICLTFLLRR
jgi:hypothetical protein